ncbi:Prohormone and neuropeptide processing protease [Paragonimus heterotremus]|uniref:Neuroendocrine convertase 2 n=1 Tax=Paragonimus heterotremus TaxID=100268 RepID=A0A8J4WG47_9TREM|nr:Prohormone and neuropeptide processing protease [Paragonimus heterotremus]
MQLWILVVLVEILISPAAYALIHTNQWLVRLHHPKNPNEDVDQIAKEVAKRLGFTPLPKHPLLESNEYVFVHRGVPHAQSNPSHVHTHLLTAHPSVHTATQVEGFMRRKRGYRPLTDESLTRIQLPSPRKLSTREQEIVDTLKQTDPMFTKEWYLYNVGQAKGVPGLDLNVLAAWAQNITGRGVVTAIMDDGVDYLHPDIAPNYAAEASYDFSSNDAFPYPRYTDDWFNSHGTRCAGEVSAVAGNNICGVGVAPNSRVAGLRMLDQPYMTDLIEAAAMAYARDIIHIYSASWGPTDDGTTVDGPRNQTMRALVDGVNNGRGGKGSLYVWASGDGGQNDDCNCDGYAASMWTISINSVTNDGHTAVYDESCASTLASTFSNGKSSFRQDAGVATVDLYGQCTLHHSGTSAAAPEAAGVFALALEAQPELTWRDMQHLTVLASKRNHLYDREHTHNWTINGAGLEFNHLFGFGVLDAGDMVRLAKNWKTVPERFHCIAGSFEGRKTVRFTEPIEVLIDTDACKSNLENQVNYLEHVQAFVSIKATRRGDLTIFLTSPMNTTSMLLRRRPHDADSLRGFTKWPFMTTHTWGENPRGIWRLTVLLDPRSEDIFGHATLTEWILVLHGTRSPPYDHLPDSMASIAPKLGVVKRQHATDRFKA